MILTAIVITMGIAAFVLALTYRSYRLTTDEEVSDDPEDTRVSQLTDEEPTALDEDRPRPRPSPRHRRARRAATRCPGTRRASAMSVACRAC